ncbi:MAG: hypothetical protein AVDCRST_MAG01-01-1692, partial [uncultured Rubrobacteraceae bacterium]
GDQLGRLLPRRTPTGRTRRSPRDAGSSTGSGRRLYLVVRHLPTRVRADRGHRA